MSLLQILKFKPYSKVNNDPYAPAIAGIKKLERALFLDVENAISKASDQGRERLLYSMANKEGALDLAKSWVAAKPSSAFARLFLGVCLIVAGWEIRGGAYADEVPKNAWDTFFKYLKDAEVQLREAIRLDNKLVDPYAWLINASLGGNDSSASLEYKLFVDATSIEPLNWPVHLKYFYSVTDKWGGSHEEMFGFVKHVSNTAPSGSILHCLVAQAYLEYYLARCSEVNDPLNVVFEMKKPDYAKDVVTALYKWLGATPSNLGDKLGQITGAFSAHALNHFAAALFLCGAKIEAKAVLLILNNEIECSPWGWLALSDKEENNSAFVYDRACRELGVKLQPA